MSTKVVVLAVALLLTCLVLVKWSLDVSGAKATHQSNMEICKGKNAEHIRLGQPLEACYGGK